MTQVDNHELDVHAWLARVVDDELNAKSLLKHRDGAPIGVCFLAQQMAEKSLKALLIFYTKQFPKIHDIPRLATILEPYVLDIFVCGEEFTVLNKYYAITRYPADLPEGFSWEEAEQAYTAARRIQEFVLSKLPH